ncbi:MAG: phage portal protein, partial [Phycisphaerales bacterium]|nr:phage portal protein [Phycisphaerales bacterium]
AASAWYKVSQSITTFQGATFENGGFPSIIASGKGLTEPQRKHIKAELDRRMRGAKKAGSIVALEGDLTLERWSMSQEELGFLQASKDMRDFIAAAFGVPTSLLTVEDVNLANGQVAAPQWQLQTIRPLAARIEDALNKDLMPKFRAALGDPSLCVAFDNPVEEEQAERDTRAVSLYQGGLITQNEGREMAGFDSVKEGDSFFTTATPAPELGPNGFPLFTFTMPEREVQRVVIDSDGVKRLEAHARDQGDSGAVSEQPYSDGHQRAEARASRLLGRDRKADQGRPGPVSERLSIYLGTDHDQGAAGGLVLAKRLSNGDIEWKDDDDDDFRRIQASVAKSEAELNAALEEYFDRLMPEVAGSIRSDGTVGLDLGPDSDAAFILRDLLSPAATEAFVRGVELGLSELPDIGDDVVRTATDRAREAAQASLVRLSESTLSTVEEGVELRIQEALTETAGEDFREVQRQVADALGRDSDMVSRRIARTESNRMHSDGRLTGWRESGVVTRKRWLTRGDTRVAEPCLTIARQYAVAEVDKPFVPRGTTIAGFTFNYDPRGLMAPPAKPNCRCTIIPEVD